MTHTWAINVFNVGSIGSRETIWSRGFPVSVTVSCGSSSVLTFLPLSLTQKDWKEQRFLEKSIRLQIYIVYNKIGKRNGKAQRGKQAFNKPNVHDGEITVFH